MRKSFDRRRSLGQTPIDDVAIPAKSRDGLPPVLTEEIQSTLETDDPWIVLDELAHLAAAFQV